MIIMPRDHEETGELLEIVARLISRFEQDRRSSSVVENE